MLLRTLTHCYEIFHPSMVLKSILSMLHHQGGIPSVTILKASKCRPASQIHFHWHLNRTHPSLTKSPHHQNCRIPLHLPMRYCCHRHSSTPSPPTDNKYTKYT